MHACREASRGYSLHLRSWRIAEGALGATFADVEREPHQRGGGGALDLADPPAARSLTFSLLFPRFYGRFFALLLR